MGKTLDLFLGKLERFFLEHADYIAAKIIIAKYNRHPERYDLSNSRLYRVLEDAKLTVSLWEKRRTLDNYCKK